MRLDSLKGKQLRAAVYCRFGFLDDSQYTTIDLIADLYGKLMKRYGWKFSRLFIDFGGSNERRDQLLVDCRNSNFDLIITRSLVKLDRNTERVISLIDAFHETNTGIYFEEIDMYSPLDYLKIAVLCKLVEQARTDHSQG